MNPLKKFEEWYRRRHRIVRGIIDLIITGAFLVWLLFIGMYLFAVLGSILVGGLFGILYGGNILDILLAVLSAILWTFWGILDPRVTIELLGGDWKWIRPIISLGAWILIVKFTVQKVAERWKERKAPKEAKIWEFEDQFKGLKEQLSLGHITQEEYEEKRKKLLDKHQAR